MKNKFVVFISVIMCLFVSSFVFAGTKAETQAMVEKWDKKNLRYSTGMATDKSRKFIKIPENYPGKRDFIVAKAVPTVDFAPIRGIYPEFFPDDNQGYWSQFAEVTKGSNGCFYMATGDHRCQNGKVFITEYDPVKENQHIVVDVGKICGWKKNQYVHGKIHGRMDIMQDGTLVAATWNGSPIKQEWLDQGYVKGGYLLTYNIFTGVAESHGIPFYGDSWPYHSVDTQTGVIMAVGAYDNFMAYNVLEKKLLYGGMPPDGIKWCRRATLLDERTGMLYSSDTGTKNNQFVSYNQRTNEFRRLNCSVPPNPVTGKINSLRAYTARRHPNGLFYCMESSGGIFTFSPDEDKTESIGINWDNEGLYVTSVALSPGNRYLYYFLCSRGDAYKWGAPVIQYNIQTGQKKVIAFLAPYYFDKYGHILRSTFGIELSEDGSLLVMHMNGMFGPNAEEAYRYPSIFAIHIPESEREE